MEKVQILGLVEVLEKEEIKRKVEELKKSREGYLDLLEMTWLLSNKIDQVDGILAIDLETGEFFAYARDLYGRVDHDRSNYIDVITVTREFEYSLKEVVESDIDYTFYPELDRKYNESWAIDEHNTWRLLIKN